MVSTAIPTFDIQTLQAVVDKIRWIVCTFVCRKDSRVIFDRWRDPRCFVIFACSVIFPLAGSSADLVLQPQSQRNLRVPKTIRIDFCL